jgi:hypothetical protein
MEWIDEANRLLRAHQERERAISEQEVEMFGALWEELKRHIESAKATFPGLVTNGRPEARTISFPMQASSAWIGFPPSVTVSLDRERHQVTAEIKVPGHEVTEVFDFDLKTDGLACLKRQGVEVPDKEIAIYILRPFLYPELPPYTGATGAKGRTFAISAPEPLKIPRTTI